MNIHTLTNLKQIPQLSDAISTIAKDTIREIIQDVNERNVLGSLITATEGHLYNIAGRYFKEYPLLDEKIKDADELVLQRLSVIISSYIWHSDEVVVQVLKDTMAKPGKPNVNTLGVVEVLLMPTKFDDKTLDDILDNGFTIDLEVEPTKPAKEWAIAIINKGETNND